MIDPDMLVDGVLRGVLGGRRKKSRKAYKYLNRGGRTLMSNPNALLAVAGVAWGIFETLQNQGGVGSQGTVGSGGLGGSAGSGGSTGSGGSVGSQGSWNTGNVGPVPVPTPPLPNVSGEAATIPSDALRIVRLAIAAAHADGSLSDRDRTTIVDQARAAGAEHLVEQELAHRPPLASIVTGITDPLQRATLYVLAFGIVRADESVSGAERIFLAQLANQLGLDPETVKKLEADAAKRIDSQDPI
jgi:uncharacterized membrane protein YebE (DUF533 family)